jgi:large subunit ribosomal protein L18
MNTNPTKTKRESRRRRVRAKVSGTVLKPRLSVFRSVKHIYLQLIDDVKGKSLLQMGDDVLDSKKKMTKKEKAYALGVEFAKEAKAKKINKVVFDRAGFRYHGRVSEVARGAREGGLQF